MNHRENLKNEQTRASLKGLGLLIRMLQSLFSCCLYIALKGIIYTSFSYRQLFKKPPETNKTGKEK